MGTTLSCIILIIVSYCQLVSIYMMLSLFGLAMANDYSSKDIDPHYLFIICRHPVYSWMACMVYYIALLTPKVLDFCRSCHFDHPWVPWVVWVEMGHS